PFRRPRRERRTPHRSGQKQDIKVLPDFTGGHIHGRGDILNAQKYFPVPESLMHHPEQNAPADICTGIFLFPHGIADLQPIDNDINVRKRVYSIFTPQNVNPFNEVNFNLPLAQNSGLS
ncbi:hypothetical protein ACS106_004760, partial [Escherichia coli]